MYALTKGIGAVPKPDNLGVFTVGLLRAVKRWQRNHELEADGVVGPRTQQHILLLAAQRADEKAGLPRGCSYGFVVFEGGGILAATNWQVPGGVDCGPAQWRRIGPPFDRDGLRFAFDPHRSLQAAAAGLRARRDDYLKRRPGLGKGGALKTAVLAHNAPFLAEQIVARGRLDDPDAPASWTWDPVAHRPYTRGEWSQVYPARVLSFAL